MPAEWEPHAATWLAWPHNEDDWPGNFAPIPRVFAEIVSLLSTVERVRLIVDGPDREAAIWRLLVEAKADVGQIDFFHAPTNRSWTRDFVPLFVRRSGEIRAVKFRFNGWARYDNHELDDAAGRRVPSWLGVDMWEAAVELDGRARPVVLEGGAIDVDGEGTLLASEECLVTGTHGRNPWLGMSGTEEAMREYLGVEKVIWVGAGIAGDDTAGHVDDFVRFAAPGRVVLAEETRTDDPNYAALAAAAERLASTRDAAGRRIEVIRLPMPGPVMWNDERLPASYANYYVANDLVLVPTFDDRNDERALGILRELFPTRRVVGIRSRDLVLGLGTIHCSTHEEPAR
jgi:agmatine deiminase